MQFKVICNSKLCIIQINLYVKLIFYVTYWKVNKQLGQGYYIDEISSNNTHLFIAAYDVESPESLLIELPERRAADILNEFNNDYEAMASSLQVMNKRLVLLNPVSSFLEVIN